MTEKLGAAIHSLDHFSLTVPNLDEAERYYTSFGLAVSRRGDVLEIRAYGDAHVWLIVRPGTRKQLDYVCLGLFAEDMPTLRARLVDRGIQPLAPPYGGGGDDIWLREPAGSLLCVGVRPKMSVDAKDLSPRVPSGEGVRGSALRGVLGPVRPRRLAHTLLFTSMIEQTIDFYVDILGLRVSDFPGPVAFLHCTHGSDHHVVALASCPVGGGYHHSAWDVETLDDVGRGALQMEDAGYGEGGWGLGRHVLGSNYFHYVRDPWGSYTEYSFDIDYIPKSMDWKTGYPSPENSLYLWGPKVPDDFTVNHEADPGG
jgi:catechol 2,3-dioxygenase-like lactoylglutathione lyase family enzyme